MHIDLNCLRKETAYSLDKIIKILNRGILPENDFSSHEIDEKYKTWEGDVLVSKEDLQQHIDDLRQNVMIWLCCFDKDNPNYQAVYDEVVKSGGVARFNEEEK